MVVIYIRSNFTTIITNFGGFYYAATSSPSCTVSKEKPANVPAIALVALIKLLFAFIVLTCLMCLVKHHMLINQILISRINSPPYVKERNLYILYIKNEKVYFFTKLIKNI